MDTPEGTWFHKATAGADRMLATNSREGQLNACLAGAGLACLPRYLADPHRNLNVVTLGETAPARDIWVGTHQDTRGSARIRAVLVWIDGVMQRARGRLHPQA